MIWVVAFVVYACTSYALTFNMQFAELWNFPRELLRGGPKEETERGFFQRWMFLLFDCSFCLGTWSGILLALGALGVLEALQVPWASVPVVAVAFVGVSALTSATVGFFGYLLTQKLL